MGIEELAKKYNLEKTDFWEMKFGGKSMWIITHDACEKIADNEEIQFSPPQIHADNNTDVAMIGSAKKGEKVIWTTGEASPRNNKNPYNWAMAEKRLKDRLTLKMINAYEYGVSSEVEADAYKKGE